VLSSAYLEKGEILTINALGLEHGMSLRQSFDGYTFFGCKKSIKKMKNFSSSSPQTQLKLAKDATNEAIGPISNPHYLAQMGATGTSNEDGVTGGEYFEVRINLF